jgi:hypothetical protein
MSVGEYPHSFRIRGKIFNTRKRVEAAAAFDAYRTCAPVAHIDEESYLGVFQFREEFAVHLAETGSPGGFAGCTWSAYVWWDVDRDEHTGGVASAIEDTRLLIDTLETRYGVSPDLLLPFLSGGKGCHLGLPTQLWRPAGGASFHLTTRQFAENVAAEAGVAIDTGIYDRVRAFRSPNSRHPKTGLHKRFIPAQQFGVLSLEDALALAANPALFELPDLSGVGVSPRLVTAWETAALQVEKKQAVFDERRRELATHASTVQINRLTVDLIRGEKVDVGDRHRTIYSAARNLAEAGASRHLVMQLLREASLDTGLPPKEVDRQIECGIAAAASGSPAPDQGLASAEGRSIASAGRGAPAVDLTSVAVARAAAPLVAPRRNSK